jgi:formylglycine-generating enzyme required for sulfatase activity
MRRARVAVSLAIAGAWLLAACSAILDFDALTRGPAAPPAEAGDAPLEAAPVDAGDGGARPDADAALLACPGDAGPTMVKVDAYCIDSTEITLAQYQTFLGATTDGDPRLQPAACASNATFVPTCAWPPFGDTSLPVRCVDWCDAYAYCAWAGKRLCGATGGGVLPFDQATSSVTSQWYRACTHAGTREFPYGDAGGGDCNDESHAGGAVLAAGSLATCEGGYPGIFDMVGNVYEWTDSCESTTDPDAGCNAMGGAFTTTGVVKCSQTLIQPRLDPSTSTENLGFRCCAP